jgi:hypothetical protein
VRVEQTRNGGITVRHSIRGRLRLRVPLLKALRGDRSNRRAVSLALAALPGVRQAEVHPFSTSVIFTYDTGVVGEAALLRSIVQRFGTPERRRDFLRHLSPLPPGGEGAEEYVPARPWQMLEVAALTALLGYRAIRRILFRQPLPQAPLSATGLVSAVASIPMVRRAMRDVFRGHPLGLFPYLALSVGLSIASGASATALEIVWAVSLGFYLEGALRFRPSSSDTPRARHPRRG